MALAFTAGLGSPVPILVWESFWGLTTLSRSDRQAVVVSHYHLEYVDVLEPPDFEPVPSVGFTDALFWGSLVVFFASPDGACLDGCPDWYPP